MSIYLLLGEGICIFLDINDMIDSRTEHLIFLLN